jgi:DNA-binding Lrp family transcriptional regulator
VLRCPSVLSCYLMSGSSDYLMSVLARDIEDFERVHKRQPLEALAACHAYT